MYDIVFLSYHEPHADEHWDLLKARFPRARRVDGVTGLVAAHQEAASLCKTRYFWVVDADNVVRETFNFDFRWDRLDPVKDRVAVWRAENNANGLVYGYGGVKLLPRRAVLRVPIGVTDFTTSISKHFHVMEEVASTTIITATPFEAWKAAFRECAKLSAGVIRGRKTSEDTERLATWKTKVRDLDVPNHQYVIEGAYHGAVYGETHGGNPIAMRKINDWQWLRDRFHATVLGEIVDGR